jgi:hypothetical protein
MSQKKIKKVINPQKYHPQAVRHAKDVDLSKASPDCKRCDGSGITGAINPDKSMQKGGVTDPVPIVCRCVTENGGVLVHPLQKVMTELRAELKSGQWAKQQLDDLRVMGEGNKQRALASIRRMMENDDSDPLWKEEARKVLETIENEGANDVRN